jgi:hypothetical protein
MRVQKWLIGFPVFLLATKASEALACFPSCDLFGGPAGTTQAGALFPLLLIGGVGWLVYRLWRGDKAQDLATEEEYK